MKNYFHIFMICITLMGCAIDPVEERKQAEEKAQEERRWAALSPKQKCMEKADYDKNFCGVQCALGNVDGRNPERYQRCSSTCINQQVNAYQICSYK